MSKPPYINVSKLDVAKRQLEIAITLFLTNSDPISIHTLSAAAHEVLNTLLKKQNLGRSFLDENVKRFIRPEKQKEVIDKIREAQNFFKHADKDSDGVYKFHFKLTEFFLWDTCAMYQILIKEKTPLISVFLIWFYSAYPNILLDEETKTLFLNCQNDLGVNPENRSEFLNLLPDIIKSRNRITKL